MGFPCSSVSKESACSAGDPVSIPGSGRSPGEGNSNPLQYSCLENPTDRGAWQTTVHGVARVRHNLATKETERVETCCIAQGAQFSALWWPRGVGWKWWWEGGSQGRRYMYVCAALSPFSRVQFFATPWTVAHQAPLSMGFSRQEYWSRLPFPPPGPVFFFFLIEV